METFDLKQKTKSKSQKSGGQKLTRAMWTLSDTKKSYVKEELWQRKCRNGKIIFEEKSKTMCKYSGCQHLTMPF